MKNPDRSPNLLPGEDAKRREQAMIAHDIRGALHGVLGGIALIDRSRLHRELLPQLDRIAVAGEALAALVEAMVLEPAARPPARRLPLNPPVELEPFLQRIERRWTGEAQAKGLRFRIEKGRDLPPGLHVMDMDLSRILANLIGNAIKFSQKGCVTLALQASADGGLVLRVRDEGPGLSGCDRTRLFDFGYRLPVGSGAGEGIGLHVAKELTERLGGRLTIEEQTESGVEAVVRLPAALSTRATGSGALLELALPDLARRRILLAEDNPTNQIVASQMLDALNATVVVASDGLEAMRFFEQKHFDLLVIDIEMPRMSGLEVIRAIRARTDRRARTPIVALTAYAMKEHRLRIAEAGADGLISKPILSAEAFGKAIAQHLAPPMKEERAPEEEPSIDRAVFASLSATIGGELMTELLDRIVSDLEGARSSLEAARETLDIGSIRTSSHILISVAGAFGAARLRSRASCLNAAANKGTGEMLAAALRACLADIPPAVQFARDQRAQC